MYRLKGGAAIVLAVMAADRTAAFAPSLQSASVPIIASRQQPASSSSAARYSPLELQIGARRGENAACALLASSAPNGDDGSSGRKVSIVARILSVLKRSPKSGSQAEEEETPPKSVIQRVLSLHNPKTYLALAAYSLYKYRWCARSMFYWFAVGFCIKWYRARYVFNIPVWDRQPNWNNVITSKEQEKDLKAFTCKSCGSTLFIAKTREFFFEGGTGLGGLGCFTCGAKGKDNFIMDRDRIVEDVADMDDYFEYERPLDFVSRSERRKIMKQAGGDEEKANQILLERETTAAADLETTDPDIDAFVKEADAKKNGEMDTDQVADAAAKPPAKKKKKKKKPSEAAASASSDSEPAKPKKSKTIKKKKKNTSPTPSTPPSPAPPAAKDASSDGSDDLDILGMDF